MAFANSCSSDSEADDFINISIGREGGQGPQTHTRSNHKDFYSQWVEQSSAKLSIPIVSGAEALRDLYPKHSIVLTQGYGMNILGFPGATVTPIEETPLLTNLVFIPLSRADGIPGVLANQIVYGAFRVVWKQFEYLIFMIQYPQGFGVLNQYFVLHEGPEEASRLFLLAAGAWADALHDEIWVFNQGFWHKDHALWAEIQKADWADVILKEEFKKALQKDVYGFFASEKIYKELAIPWKRGLIMYGPPGNGKTISLKTIMKTCGEKGFAPLYVKSFQSYKGEEGAMADVFDKARQLAPCLVILEDLDSLINDRNRSFFLNQLDGLESNDGLLIIGTTNHFERLDPGISSRPSRFDRKYLFDDPDEDERRQYAQYWKNKLKSNKEIAFPDELVCKVARLTDKFSFAYLKEAFVSSLVSLAGVEGEKPSFESLLLAQIETLRKQLDKSDLTAHRSGSNTAPGQSSNAVPSIPTVQATPRNSAERDLRTFLGTVSQKVTRFNPSNLFEANNGPVIQHPASSTDLQGSSLQGNGRKVKPFSNIAIVMDSPPASTAPLEANLSHLRETSPGHQINPNVFTKRFQDIIAQNSLAKAPENTPRFSFSSGVEHRQVPSGSQNPLAKAPETKPGFSFSSGVEHRQVPFGSPPYLASQQGPSKPGGAGTFGDSLGGLV